MLALSLILSAADNTRVRVVFFDKSFNPFSMPNGTPQNRLRGAEPSRPFACRARSTSLDH